jgi:preprotein translocase subunit SecY
MFKTIANAFKIKEIRNKILLTLLLLLIYRIGCFLPVAGLNIHQFSAAIDGQEFLSLLSSISGGALSQGAILALGISPYISASIIIQLLTIAIPALERLSKQGEEGKKRIGLYTKICALVLAISQSIAIVVAFSKQGILNTTMFGYESPAWIVGTIVVITLVAGSMFTYFLGDKITEIGVGNGQSLLIFVGLLSTAGSAIFKNLKLIFTGDTSGILPMVLFVIALLVIFGVIVFIDLSERKVPVQYAKQVKGRKMYGGQSTHIPIRVNATGVMPIIFAMSILSFPQLLISIFDADTSSGFSKWYTEWLGAGSWIYIVVMCLLILFFAYFWTTIQFNTEDISKNIQQNGGFIPGIRPGRPTADYLKKISNRITLFGATFLAFIALVPSVIFGIIGGEGLTGAFSATGLLIVVSVAIEFDKQLEALMLMRNYKGFLNK